MSAGAVAAGVVFLLVVGVAALVVTGLVTLGERVCRACHRRIVGAPWVDARGPACDPCRQVEHRAAS